MIIPLPVRPVYPVPTSTRPPRLTPTEILRGATGCAPYSTPSTRIATARCCARLRATARSAKRRPAPRPPTTSDRVNLRLMESALLRRGMPPGTARIIVNCYRHNESAASVLCARSR